MKIDYFKKRKITELLQDEINDAELDDVEIEVTGYREYNVSNFSLNLDVEEIIRKIIKVLEEDE